jgi:hypothetical protein
MDSQEHPMNAADVLSTMIFALEQGISPAELLDENSPLMDEARRVLKPVDPATQTDAQPVGFVLSQFVIDWYSGTPPAVGTKLYTHPPAPHRTLTDEEIDNVSMVVEWGVFDVAGLRKFARAVLAAQETKK